MAMLRSSFIRLALNEISFRRLRISRARARRAGALDGLICTSIVSCDAHSRISGVSVGLPEKPPSQ